MPPALSVLKKKVLSMTVDLTTVACRVLLLTALTATLAAAAPLPSPAYTIVDRIAGPDGGWDFATVDPVKGRLYVARSNAVMSVDLASGKVTPQLAPANGAHQVLVVRNGAEVVETDGKTNLTRFIDADTGTVLAEIKTGIKPDAALLDPATGTVVVMSPGDGSVSFIDPASRTLAGTVMVGGSLEVGVADGKGLVYVNVEDRNEVAILDVRARKVVGRFALTGCDGPTGIALVAGGTRLISSCANGVASVSDPATRRVEATLPIGRKPDGVLFDRRRGLAFVPTGEGFLEIIAAATPRAIRVVGRLVTQPSAKTGALDERTGRIYLPSATVQPPVAPATRGTTQPGSFKVLVIAPSA